MQKPHLIMQYGCCAMCAWLAQSMSSQKLNIYLWKMVVHQRQSLRQAIITPCRTQICFNWKQELIMTHSHQQRTVHARSVIWHSVSLLASLWREKQQFRADEKTFPYAVDSRASCRLSLGCACIFIDSSTTFAAQIFDYETGICVFCATFQPISPGLPEQLYAFHHRTHFVSNKILRALKRQQCCSSLCVFRFEWSWNKISNKMRMNWDLKTF